MKTGKLAEPVWRRSVCRQLHMEFSGENGHYGADCTQMCGPAPSASVGPLPGFAHAPEKQVMAAANRLAACGAELETLAVHAALPAGCEEAAFQSDLRRIASAAAQYEAQAQDVCAYVTPAVSQPQYFVTGFGRMDDGAKKCEHESGAEEGCAGEGCGSMKKDSVRSREEHAAVQSVLRPGQELVVTKWIALGGTAALALRCGEELRTRYPFSLVDRAAAFENVLDVRTEAKSAYALGDCAIHCMGEGGVFCALWEMAERAGTGLDLDLKKIPIRQESVELCEYFDINPYCLYSEGALLIGTDHAELLVASLAAQGIAAAVIGRVTKGRERVIRNGEDCRYLERPQQEEWYRRMTWQS